MPLPMKIGFAKRDITPPVGIELGGYAGYRPCAGVHDPLYCKAVVLEQGEKRYALVALDFLSVDEPVYRRLSEQIAHLGILPERLVLTAIHSHASPCGVIQGEGVLARVNRFSENDPVPYRAYMERVLKAAVQACEEAVRSLEGFQVRHGQGELPLLGSERHTGAPAQGEMTAIQIQTDSGRNLILYHFPCHPTVMRPDNLLASADFIGGIESFLGSDMAVFLNGAAGDISTRFTRRESTFSECDRMGRLAAERILDLLEKEDYHTPSRLVGTHVKLPARPRAVDTLEYADELLKACTARWQQAVESGADPGTLRLLQSQVEGAGVNLEFAETMEGITEFQLPVTIFRFSGFEFITIPGELYSTLKPEGMLPICYANGYYRYIVDKKAYEDHQYEAMAAILDVGEGERLMDRIAQIQKEWNRKKGEK